MVRHVAILLWLSAGILGFYISETAFVESADVQTMITITICGDGLTQDGYETCDEGTGGNLGGYGSTTAERQCAPGCVSYGPYCGDDTLQVRFDEECDDCNQTDGDLCSASCQSETAVPPPVTPTGAIPQVPGANPGAIPAQTETRVVVRGKAYPGSEVNILLDGKILGSAIADTNADFQYNSTELTPGVASLGFWARDRNGTQSITTSIVFEIVQSAVTNVSNVYFPPTIAVSAAEVAPGELLQLSGQTVPAATVVTELFTGSRETMQAVADASGLWALQIDTASISQGRHTAKSYFELGTVARSGYGRSVAFAVGAGAGGAVSPDINGDGKVNLVDFSIFLLSWNTSDARADFNVDGSVNLADFSIMLFSWTG